MIYKHSPQSTIVKDRNPTSSDFCDLAGSPHELGRIWINKIECSVHVLVSIKKYEAIWKIIIG